MKDASRDLQVDLSQDYCLLLGYENKTHTVLRFSRRYDTCDPRDLKITVGDLIYTASGVKDNFACRAKCSPEDRLMDLREKLNSHRRGRNYLSQLFRKLKTAAVLVRKLGTLSLERFREL